MSVLLERAAVTLGEEVQDALAHGRPVVALESSVIAQGLPPPHNLANARACEAAVRAAGEVPATTAVIGGVVKAGLADRELAQLADPTVKSLKVAARDLPVAVALGLNGGTTVAATCAIADAAGIAVFATGGIGGVHREAERTFDVSQDLAAIASCRVAVVTAGAKAILDLPKTLELLEALAVPVLGLNAREFPAFYSNHSGLPLEHVFDSVESIAKVLRARWSTLGQRGGVIVANPLPAGHEADSKTVEAAIAGALEAARQAGVSGKRLTPFLLGEVARRTHGESMEANLALLENNARVAGELAVALGQLAVGA